MKWMKKKPLHNFFKLNALGRKGLSPRRKRNGSHNCSLKENETKLPQGVISLGEKGTKFPKGATST
jgi:hypothetical protein